MAIKNLSQLTDDLLANYEKLKSGKIEREDAKVLAQLAGKVISSAKTQMEYNAQMGNKKKVKILE